VGYRTKVGGDVLATPDTFGKLHVYTAAITNTYDPKPTNWKGALGTAGQAWELPGTGLVVRLQSFTRVAAVVSVCRRGGTETAATCRAGIDNDCNGMAGPKDPACARLLRRAARQ